MIKNSRQIFRILLINIFLLAPASVGILLTIELYARTQHYWISPFSNNLQSHKKIIDDAKKIAVNANHLKLAIGDSFGQHFMGTDKNLLDGISKCRQEAGCSYLNLSIIGSSPEDYFKTLKEVLSARKAIPGRREEIVISLYYGNDTINYAIKELDKTRKEKCFSHQDKQPKVSRPEAIKTWVNNFLNQYIVSINIYRQLYRKFRFNTGRVNQYLDDYLDTALQIRNCIYTKHVSKKGVVNNLSAVDKSYLKDVIEFKYSPTDLYYALAYPDFNQDLYSMDANWSQVGVQKLKNEIIKFNQYLNENFPNSSVMYLGIPDKFIWAKKLDPRILVEYNKVGLNISRMVNDDLSVKSKYLNLTNSMNKFFAANNINYIYLPRLINPESHSIYSLFYPLDPHLNAHGNIVLTKKINKLIQSRNNGS